MSAFESKQNTSPIPKNSIVLKLSNYQITWKKFKENYGMKNSSAMQWPKDTHREKAP